MDLGKWGHKSQETQEKQPAASVPPTHEEDEDEDDSKAGFSRESNRRNSRFYRSMRKKRLASSEQSESKTTSGLCQTFKLTSCTETIVLFAHVQLKALSILTSLENTTIQQHGWKFSSTLALCLIGADRAKNSLLCVCVVAPKKRFNIKMNHKENIFICTCACPNMELLFLFLFRLSNGESPQTICHSLNIIKNIAFLYQEYRDTSKQQEIEQRRQRENLSPEVRGGTVVGDSGVMSPPVLQLQLRNSSLSLWQNLEAVQASGLLTQLPHKEIIMQEAMFELVTSEASYYKSLEILETHFLRNPVLISTLSQSDMHFLFSNIEEVMKASERFLMDLEHRIEKSILISDVCDIVYHHAVEHFSVFIKYVINQVYQEKTYRRILEGNQAFREAMATLEKHPRVRGLSFTSFLILPFQRITRLKLLVQNILKKAEENSEREANAIKAHQQLEQIVKDCNEGVRKMSRTEELISIEKTLEFKSKSVPIISHSRWLLKKGEVQLMAGPKSTRTMRSRKLYQPVYLFLFNNLLLVTKPSSSGEKFQVLDSCTRAMLRTEDLEDQGQMLANVFNLKLLENQEDRQVSYMLKTSSMSDKLRWMCALTPNRRTRFMSTSAHQADSPQVQCIQSYSSQEPDELSIEMADVLNLLERTDDGWMMGERLHDGERGWFPSRVVEEIQSKEVRAQNLREAFRIQQAQEGGGGHQSGTRVGMKAGRRTHKVSSFSSNWNDQMGGSS
uniref:Neuronal guanine nucleotide exchange factor n=1 Tax=Anabas testudineus TaxID=64144 RepID=A0A7N6A6G1_ANATE